MFTDLLGELFVEFVGDEDLESMILHTDLFGHLHHGLQVLALSPKKIWLRHTLGNCPSAKGLNDRGNFDTELFLF